MPPRANSRYLFCSGVHNGAGVLFLTEREPYRFHQHPDNRIHRVVQGDTLWGLAGRYFAPLERACGFWWAIADYQEDPILDPTLDLEEGRLLVIPSVRVLSDVVLGEARRREVG